MLDVVRKILKPDIDGSNEESSSNDGALSVSDYSTLFAITSGEKSRGQAP